MEGANTLLLEIEKEEEELLRRLDALRKKREQLKEGEEKDKEDNEPVFDLYHCLEEKDNEPVFDLYRCLEEKDNEPVFDLYKAEVDDEQVNVSISSDEEVPQENKKGQFQYVSKIEKLHLEEEQEEEDQGLSNWDLMFMKIRKKVPDANQLAFVLSDRFFHAASVLSKMIVSEKHLQEYKKKISPSDVGGVAGGTKYSVHGLFFKYPVDSLHGFTWLYGGISANHLYAAKGSNHEWKAFSQMMAVDQDHVFQYPLYALIDYQGFRLQVMTTLPINSKTLVYGSNDAGKSMKWNKEVHEGLLKIANKLNLLPHKGPHNSDMALCGDAEIHEVNTLDAKYYFCLDLARVFPPDFPQTGITGSIFFRLLRPELVKMMTIPLSSDALSGWQQDPENVTLNKNISLAHSLLKQQVADFAVTLSNKAQNNALIGTTLRAIQEPKFNGIPIIDPIVRELHSRGINLRYLGLLVSQIVDNPELEVFLCSVIVVRAIKNLWKDAIQSQKKGQRIYELCLEKTLEVLNNVLNLEWQKTFWSEVKINCQKTFGDVLPADHRKFLFLKNNLRKLHLPWIIIRFCQMVGVVLSSTTALDLVFQKTTKCFSITHADILDFIPVVKNLPILDYYVGLYWLEKVEKVTDVSAKKNILYNAYSRLSLVLQFPFPNVRQSYAIAQFQSVKLNKKTAYDGNMIIQILKEQYLDICRAQKSKEEQVSAYLNYLLAIIWKVFEQEETFIIPDDVDIFNFYKERKLNQLQSDTMKTIFTVLDRSQQEIVLGCTFQYMEKRKIEYKLITLLEYFEVNDILVEERAQRIQQIENEFPHILIELLKEAKDWDINVHYISWFFSKTFSFSTLVKQALADKPAEQSILETCKLFSNDPLNDAFFGEQWEGFKLLRQNGLTNHVVDKDNRTLMHVLLAYLETDFLPKAVEVVTFVSEHGVNAEDEDNNGRTLLNYVCSLRWSYIPTFQWLMNTLKPNLNAADKNGNRPLHNAILGGQDDLVRILIAANCDLYALNNDGTSALQLAAQEGKTDIANILLENSCNLDSPRSPEGRTALHIAVAYGSDSIVTLLVSSKCDVSAVDGNGMNVLHQATFEGKQKILSDLIPYCIKDINNPDKAGRTPIHLAFVQQSSEPLMMKLTNTLLDAGADINARMNTGETVLHLTCREHPDLVPFLLTKGVMASLKNNNGATALDLLLLNFPSHPGLEVLKAASGTL